MTHDAMPLIVGCPPPGTYRVLPVRQGGDGGDVQQLWQHPPDSHIVILSLTDDVFLRSYNWNWAR
jgi:hypothetical protein